MPDAETPADPEPRAGSLEALAAQDPDATAVLDATTGRAITRAEHEHTAAAVARGLAARHAVAADAVVAVQLAPGPDLLLVQYALGKLGASPLLLDPALPLGTVTALAVRAGARLLIAAPPAAAIDASLPLLHRSELTPLAAAHATGPRLLTGAHSPAVNVQAVATAPGGHPRLVVRALGPERLVAYAPVVGDLLGRVLLPSQGVHLVGPGADRPEPSFWASVAQVLGASVVTSTATAAADLLAVLAEHEVTSIVLDAATVNALTTLPGAVTEQADLTALQRIVVTDGHLDATLVAAATDLFGEDVLHRVWATPQTGPYAHADAAALAAGAPAEGEALSGVEVTRGADGVTAVRSPLAADGALGGPSERDGWPAAPEWRDAAVPVR